MANESRLVISIDARNAERTARDLSAELNNITNNGNKADKQVTAMGSSLRVLAGYMAGIVTIGSAINKMDAYTNLQNRLKLVTTSQRELNQATSDTFAIAQKSYQSWDSVVQVYQRFSDNAKTLGINMQQTAKLTETVSKAVAISGASTQAAEAALTQFGQALASGTLRGEELNSILEQTPALAKAIAQGMGITVGELRAVAAQGKITGDVLVEALGNSANSVDEQFARTSITIGQSLTLLDNQLTKFAESAGGASTAISGSIKLVAENLELISSAAIIAGIGYVTTAITTKALAITASATATAAETAATRAKIAEDVKSAIATTNEAKAHLALVQATNAATQAKFGATAANGRYVLASNAVTAAVTRQAAAEKAAQAATATSATIGRSLLGVLGGPVGIGLTVASLAAGYLLMRDNTAQANEKLKEQGEIANKTNEELLKLTGNDKISAVDNLTAAFEDQNKKLSDSKKSMDSVLFAIRAVSVENERARKITEDARNGVISYDEAIKLLNKEKIPTDLYDQLKKESDQYGENSVQANKSKEALRLLGKEVKLTGNAAQDAALQHNAQADAIGGVGSAAAQATKDLQNYQRQINASNLTNIYETSYLEQGYNPAQVKALVEAQKAIGLDSGILSQQQIENALKSVEIAEKRNKIEESYNDKLKEAERLRKKSIKDAEDLAKKQGEDRVSIAYSYLDDLAKMEDDFQREIQLIRKSNFGAEQKQFEDRAKARYDFEHEMYLIQMTEEINLFQWSDDQKLDHWKRTQLEIIESSGRYNNEIKQLKIKALNDEYALEKASLELRRQERSFQVREQFMSETDAMNERYRLEEANILLINDASERAHLLELKRMERELEIQKRVDSAQSVVDKIESDRSGTGAFDSIYEDQARANNASQELMNARIAEGYQSAETLQKEHLDRMTKNARDAEIAMLNLKLSYGEQITGSVAETFKSMGGEQSKAYKVMFAASKAFAIAQSVVAISQGIAMASANPFPYNLIAMATVAAETASLVSNIKAIKDTGFQSGGYTGGGGVSEIAGVVHGQEYVLNANATKRVGRDTLDAINSGGNLKSTSPVNIIINPPSGYEAITKKDGDNVTIDIVEKMIDSSWDAVSNPNSNQSRAMQSAFALQPNRNN